MKSLTEFVEFQKSQGRSTFSTKDALAQLRLTQNAFKLAAQTLTKKGRINAARRDFFLILRPEDRPFGAPDPAKWIDPLMKHLTSDYRISLLRAAAFHGSSHQAAMVFQVIAPRQLRNIEIGRQRLEFLYQDPSSFTKSNRRDWLGQLKTDAGFAKIAGVELTLLDMSRFFRRAAGINGVAQAVHDLGGKANPKILSDAAATFENSAVRRLGYLLERFDHGRQAAVLDVFAKNAKSFKDLDPAAKPIVPSLAMERERDKKWKLVINVDVEIDT